MTLMIIPVYLALLALAYYLGYILSLYSSVAYLETEELEQAVATLKGLRKKYLNVIIENPRISIQIATIFKSFALVSATLIGVLLSEKIILAVPISKPVVFAFILVLVWLLGLVFIEYLPRRRVLITSEKDIIRYIFHFALVYIIFKPVLLLYSKIISHSGNDDISEEQKEDIVERAIETLAERSGVDEPIVEEDEKEMIGQIFQLDQTEVREVMVPRINIKGFEKNTAFDEVRQKTKEFGYSRYPVYDESIDKIKGILYIKDIFIGMASDNGDIKIIDFVRNPYFVPETKIISDLLAEFKRTKTHMAIVVDEYGGTAGLVTLEDIIEEIVGEIQDEHDSEKPQIVRLPDNSMRIDAALSLEDLVEELNLDYETKDFETVGGLLYDIVGSVPTAGAKHRWKDILFEVEKTEGQRIISVKAWVRKTNDN